MNVLFISISSIPDVKQHSISLDLLREFKRNGHDISIVCALEKNHPAPAFHSEEEGFKIVRVQIGGNKKANIIEKGITTISEPYKYIAAIKKYYSDKKFDLVMYPTPPITQVKTVEFIKKRDGAKSYLLLKDIFPQNAVDIGMMSKSGVRGKLYQHFRRVEQRLYQVSDYIGCMSEANVQYVLDHNPEVDPGKVEVCPNSIEVIDKSIDEQTRTAIRQKYGLPLDKKVFVYGGNLGRPQGIPFIIDCMKECKAIDDAFFLIVGDGTEYGKLEDYVRNSGQDNLRLMRKLPKEEYDTLVAACDVGLIFLDCRFTIPNFPSRLLSYMQAKIPVLACTDPNTDIGKVITEGGIGWWCESSNKMAFYTMVQDIINNRKGVSPEKIFSCLCADYSVKKEYEIIMNHFEGE